MPSSNTLNADLDQSGTGWHRVRAYLGPSLGWKEVYARSSRLIFAAGTYSILPGDSVIFVNVAALVTLLLPDVQAWITEAAWLPATGFERALWIKDLGGNANAFNITITPFGSQAIDLLAQNFTIIQNHQLLRLYPLNDLTGWYSG